ncbi:exodeoxyribonuclease VII small subunit [Aliibacillus thermotolerans]|uniref:Exodeoxyribonuclease 7 small subunit n=1 Tax=Aliibacillus thermotolerans TaxID=1834418 RepID=A0ABW0U992_9BACI|nr:exodeoxyribonuclease VII small subunit [Aliibacillus thermotolerans]MDA3131140.1 exodeoxyribonuclease VII small subunit [Aliibacillus thermotolerans]
MTDHKEKTLSFEEAMEQLEKIVTTLEEGEVPLEKAIQMYQEGMTLSNVCHQKLKTVEKQMDRIITEDGEITSLQTEEDDG